VVENGQLVERREIDYRLAPDFAAIDPRLAGRPYDHFWMLGISATGRPGRKFFDQLVHCRWSSGEVEVWQSPPGVSLAGEPAFAEGVILVPLFDAERGESSFAVFDAFRIASGPRAVLRPGCALPLAFHGLFEPG
jgi:carotenoid cleavage dioxygenase-like enzyme